MESQQFDEVTIHTIILGDSSIRDKWIRDRIYNMGSETLHISTPHY
jgi:hypothetical protein